jgi:very-short-patch-repair endonuclease
MAFDDLHWTLEELTELQDGVLSVSQARHYFSRDRVEWAVRSGRWQRPTSRTVVLHNGPLTDQQRIWVMVLTAPTCSAVGGLTAATMDGLSGFPTDKVDIVVPAGQRRCSIPGAVLRWSSRLGPDDVYLVRAPRRTKIERSLVDAASWSRSDGMARVLLIAGVQQRLVSPRQLRSALATRGPCRRHALIEETLVDIEGGVQSIPEREFTLIVKRRGLPAPTHQAIKRHATGTYFLDADWEEYDLGCEVHGAHHREIRQWDADLTRHNEITVSGRRLLHISSAMVRHDKERVGDLLERGLRSGGWRP